MIFLVFLVFRVCVLWFCHILSSITFVNNKKIQALVNFYGFLTQKFGRTSLPNVSAFNVSGASGRELVLMLEAGFHDKTTRGLVVTA